MKFIITENKLKPIIKDYLDSFYDVDNINYTAYFDDDGNETDLAYRFYYGDFGEDDEVFQLYNKNYWTDPDDFRVELSPILFVESYGALTKMFGDRWKPIFKQWFKENFGFDVKTIDGYSE